MSDTMTALELSALGEAPRPVVRPIPDPGPGEVLVKVAAAPINPSDLASLIGAYAGLERLPRVPGLEGSGTVVKAGPGLLPRLRLGSNVAASPPPGGDGTWAQYLLTRADRVLPLGDVPLELGATMIVNPLTAWAFFDLARRGRHRAIANTAAASALGRMVLRLGKRFGIPVVHVVRRPKQAALLRSLGGEHVLDSSEADFEDALHARFERLGVTLAFDAIGGDMGRRLLTALPHGGTLVVYGNLSQEPLSAEVAHLTLQGKRLEGFLLAPWLAGKGTLSVLRIAGRVRSLLDSDLRTPIRDRVPLSEISEALARYTDAMTEGKILLLPHEQERQRRPVQTPRGRSGQSAR